MKPNLTFSGGRDLERALADLPSGTSKGVARRALKKELAKVEDLAEAFSPSANQMFEISSQIDYEQLSDSHKDFSRSVTDMFVGNIAGKGGSAHAPLLEFGTGPRATEDGADRGIMPPQPMLGPAWDAYKGGMLRGLGETLWQEIEKTVARRDAKAKKAAKG